MRVSVLGLGRMGSAIAGRLLDGGHDVEVWNRSPGRAGALVERGAREAGSVEEAAGTADVAITMLSNDDAVRSVVGAGLLDALAGVYVDCSTVSPALAAELTETVGPTRFASAPILGSPATVSAGESTILLGGAADVVDRVRPALSSVTEHMRVYAEPRLALVAKVANNLLLLDGVAALAESFAVGRAGGLDDDQLRALLGDSPLVAPGIRNRFDAVLTGHRDPWWASALGAKDAELAVEVAGDLPVTAAVRDRYRAVADRDLADDDIAAIGELYRRREGGDG